MENAFMMNFEQKKIAEFTDGLANEVKGVFVGNENVLKVSAYALDKNSAFAVGLNYKNKHYMEFMVSRNKEKGDSLSIWRFLGIKSITDRACRGKFSYPDELREVAQVYDSLTNFLTNKFGNPVSECDGRAVYLTNFSFAK